MDRSRRKESSKKGSNATAVVNKYTADQDGSTGRLAHHAPCVDNVLLSRSGARLRRNINRAISDNMLDDLGIDTNDFNTGQTIYLVSFLAAELPGGLISKKVGPFRYTPAVIVLWGGISMAQAGMNSRWSFWLLRALLGLVQGGFIPDMVRSWITM